MNVTYSDQKYKNDILGVDNYSQFFIGVNKSIMDVSVVLLAYNHERFIRKAIESVLAQRTEFEYELIIGEDCSSDCTRNIINEYVMKFPEKVRPLYRDKNLGVKGNLLDCYKHCDGDFVALLEGDDYWIDNEKLQKQVSYLKENPEFVCVAHECLVLNQNDNVTTMPYSIHNIINQEYTIDNLERFELPGQSSTLVYRNIFNEKSFHNELESLSNYKYQIDSITPFIFLKHGRIRVMPEYMSVYRYYTEQDGTNFSSVISGLQYPDYLLFQFAKVRSIGNAAETLNMEFQCFPEEGRLLREMLREFKKNPNTHNCFILVKMFVLERKRGMLLRYALSDN